MRMGWAMAWAATGWLATSVPTVPTDPAETPAASDVPAPTDSAGVETSVPTEDQDNRTLEGFENVVADQSPGALTEECLVISPAQVSDALSTAGVEVEISRLVASVDSTSIECYGESTSRADGGETTISIRVSNPTAAPPAPVPAACISNRFETSCTATAKAGVIVVIEVTDTVFLDAPTTEQITDLILADVVATLTRESGDDGAGLDASITDDDLASAVAGLAVVTAERRGDDAAFDCPLVSAETLAVPIGHDDVPGPPDEMEGTVVTTSGIHMIQCRESDPDEVGTGVVAGQFGSASDAADFVASLGQAEGGSATDIGLDTTTADCTSVGVMTQCYAFWRRGALVIGVSPYTELGGLTRADALEQLLAVLPEVLAHLGDAAP